MDDCGSGEGGTWPGDGVTAWLGVAYVLLFGHILARLCGSVRLPGVIGLLAAGLILRWAASAQTANVVSHVANFAFFLVLCRAGLEISPADLDVTTILMGLLPYLTEALFVAVYALTALEGTDNPTNSTWTADQALALGVMVAPFEDGLRTKLAALPQRTRKCARVALSLAHTSRVARPPPRRKSSCRCTWQRRCASRAPPRPASPAAHRRRPPPRGRRAPMGSAAPPAHQTGRTSAAATPTAARMTPRA